MASSKGLAADGRAWLISISAASSRGFRFLRAIFLAEFIDFNAGGSKLSMRRNWAAWQHPNA